MTLQSRKTLIASDGNSGLTKVELKIFCPREGVGTHVEADTMAGGLDFIADWLAQTLGGATS